MEHVFQIILFKQRFMLRQLQPSQGWMQRIVQRMQSVLWFQHKQVEHLQDQELLVQHLTQQWQPLEAILLLTAFQMDLDAPIL